MSLFASRGPAYQQDYVTGQMSTFLGLVGCGWVVALLGVKKYTTIIKLTNLEGHAHAHNTQQTLVFVMTFYVTATKIQVIL